MEWEIALSVDDSAKSVEHNGNPLSIKDGEFPLTSFTGSLSVFLTDGRKTIVSLFDNRPLIFKLNKDWTGTGRKVPRITIGHFIVIAPGDLVRRGHVPIEPESCSDPTFMAHYFFRKGSESTEEIGGFEECEIDTITSGFELAGKRVCDDSEMGDLFVEAPPHAFIASQVVWARVGEERAGGWSGENYKPAERTLAHILDGRQGSFFIRVYDKETILDSGNFRYFKSLREILVNGELYSKDLLLVPPPEGHHPTNIRIIDADGKPLQPILPPEAEAELARNNDLIVRPHPNADEISFELESGKGRVEITLHLPRIWWLMEREDGIGEEKWRSTPFKMTRLEFKEFADSKAILRLRLPKRIRSVNVGFDDETDRNYTKRADEVALPLEDYVDYSQIDQRLTKDSLFNVRFGQKELTLIKVVADPPPEIESFKADPPAIAIGQHSTLRWTSRNVVEDVSFFIDPKIGPVEQTGSCKVSPSETTAYTLRLTVSDKEHAKRTFTVAVQAELGPLEKRILANIYIDRRRLAKSHYEIIEQVVATFVTMDAQVVNRIDCGPRNLNGNSTRRFELTLHAPTQFAKGVGSKFGLVKTVEDLERGNVIILDRPRLGRLGLSKVVCRIMLKW